MQGTGEVEFWRALFSLLAVAAFTVGALPPLSDLVARWLHAHAIALAAWYRVIAAAVRAYRRIHQKVMQETA